MEASKLDALEAFLTALLVFLNTALLVWANHQRSKQNDLINEGLDEVKKRQARERAEDREASTRP